MHMKMDRTILCEGLHYPGKQHSVGTIELWSDSHIYDLIIIAYSDCSITEISWTCQSIGGHNTPDYYVLWPHSSCWISHGVSVPHVRVIWVCTGPDTREKVPPEKQSDKRNPNPTTCCQHAIEKRYPFEPTIVIVTDVRMVSCRETCEPKFSGCTVRWSYNFLNLQVSLLRTSLLQAEVKIEFFYRVLGAGASSNQFWFQNFLKY